MAIVQSFGTIQTFAAPSGMAVIDTRAGSWDSALSAHTYAAIYSSQPNVRTVVDFLARNIAQLGIHAFRRISDTDRERLADHDVAQWLANPNPGITRYRLMEALMQDLGIYFRAYWLKVRLPEGRIGLARLPPESMTVEGWLLPSAFIWTLPDHREVRLAPSQVVYFTGYDPCNPLEGLSPLETLRQILEEDQAAHTFRRSFWRNSARFEGVIMRPATAPKWTPDQKQAFREQLDTRFTGAGAGRNLVLEDGMTYLANSSTAKDSEYTASRKLTAEEVARAYHVPLPMVGILDHATFSNIREQHKNLYQDCLAPWCEMIQGELERQLLPESSDPEDVYLEFNIADKLKGSFEEQADSLFKMTGRPIMTANEARSRLNLPSMKDDPTADQLAMPLNTASPGALPPAGSSQEAALAAA